MLTSITTQLESKLKKVQCLSGNQLKMIAAICMLVDHVTKVFYQSIAYRVINPMLESGALSVERLMVIQNFYQYFLCGIGAVAFPVFAFAFAEAFQHTRSKKRLFLRLIIFSFLSEFVFDATFFSRYAERTPGWPWYWWHQNVFFTYLQAFCALWLMEQIGKLKSKPLSVLLQGMTVLAICYLAECKVYGDYGGYGVFLIIVIHVLRKNRLYQIIGMLFVKHLLFKSYYPLSFLISLVLILLYNGRRGEKNLKSFFYVFYPAHITIVGFLDWLVFTALWEG